jgi:ABC-type Fe3+-hydroxamate transport system substrate-binding protein
MAGKSFIDQLGREVALANFPPKRIVSLVPSQTELLAALGLEEEVVGVTKFCIYPKPWAKSKTKIGGTKDAKIDRILALKPDLIIANKEENERGTLELLQQFCPVWISDVRSVDAALDLIQQLGQLTNRTAAANSLHAAIQASFLTMKPLLAGKRVLYAIWRDPWMFAGTDTFIGDVLQRLGAVNALDETKTRYPALSVEAIIALKPDMMLLSSEPFPFKKKHVEELQQLGIQTDAKIVDGTFFSWYGSRLLGTVAYLDATF